MKLIELLELITDHTNVYIFDLWGHMIASYNGRDSIPKEFNNRYIDKIDGNGDGLKITIMI